MAIDAIHATTVPRVRPLLLRLGVAALGIAWFALLAVRPLYQPDEGRYAEIPREMLGGSGFLIPHLNGLAYLEKPPLQYWLSAAAMRVFGENEFAARLVTAVAGLVCLILMRRLGGRLWGVRAGNRTALLLMGSSLFVLLSHQLTLDMLLTCWLAAALYCFIHAQTLRADLRANRRWMLGCWAALAGAVMTKGLIGALIPAMTIVLYSLLQRDFQLYDRLALRWGLPLFVLLAAPWFVLAARANAAFLEFFFVREHFERYLTTVEHRVQPWWFFVPVLVVAVLPWLGPAVRALLTDGRAHVARGRFDPIRLLWVWCVFTLVFFSLSESKLVPYILPMVPALALLCARHEPRAWPRALLPGMALTALLALAVGGTLMLAARVGAMHGVLSTAAAFNRPLSLFAACLAVGAALAAWQWRRGRRGGALAALCGGWCVACGMLLFGSAQGDEQFSGRALAIVLRPRLEASTPVFSVGDYDQTLPFYLQRPVTLVAYRGELDLGLSQAPQRGIDSLPQFAALWSGLPQAFAVMPPTRFAALAAAGLPMRLVVRSGNSLLVSRR